MRRVLREQHKVTRAGRRWVITRITKVGRTLEIRLRLPGSFVSRLEAKAVAERAMT
jgi:hypothetical protein